MLAIYTYAVYTVKRKSEISLGKIKNPSEDRKRPRKATPAIEPPSIDPALAQLLPQLDNRSVFIFPWGCEE
jgi:hypothetical protein